MTHDAHPVPVARLLPPDAVEQLRAAAAIDPHFPPGESEKRPRVLEHVTAEIKAAYPGYFTS